MHFLCQNKAAESAKRFLVAHSLCRLLKPIKPQQPLPVQSTIEADMIRRKCIFLVP